MNFKLPLIIFLALFSGCANLNSTSSDSISDTAINCEVNPIPAPLIGASSTADLRTWFTQYGQTTNTSFATGEVALGTNAIGLSSSGESRRWRYLNPILYAPVTVQGHEEYQVMVGVITTLEVNVRAIKGKVDLTSLEKFRAAISAGTIQGTIQYDLAGVQGTQFLAIERPPSTMGLSEQSFEKILKYLDAVRNVVLTGGPTTTELALAPVVFRVKTPPNTKSCGAAREVAQLLRRQENWEIRMTGSGLRGTKRPTSSSRTEVSSIVSGGGVGSELQEDQALVSPNKRYELKFRRGGEVQICQLDDNFLCQRIIWTSDTSSALRRWKGNNVTVAKLVMQGDGNVGVYAWAADGSSSVICGLNGIRAMRGAYSLEIDNIGRAKVEGNQNGSSQIIWSTENRTAKFTCQ